jgi:deoxyribodipyrimidine photolyase-related protein
MTSPSPNHLVLILGDGLDRSLPAAAGLDRDDYTIAFFEVPAEIKRFPNHRARVLYFLGAMRAFADELRADGQSVLYQRHDDQGVRQDDTLASSLGRACAGTGVKHVHVVEPGRYGLLDELRSAANENGAELVVHNDPHFVSTHHEFEEWADGRKLFLMEHFYRTVRRKTGLLMDGGEPVGGQWNYDVDNRQSFGKKGPGLLPARPSYVYTEDFEKLRAQVREMDGLVGSVDHFQWPLTPEQAEIALVHFIEHHLPLFGTYQDAVWNGSPFLHHSLISAALNLKLLNPVEVCRRVETAYERGHAPLNAAEGFIRQIIGWREYIRGIYWLNMPKFLDMNSLGASEPLPPLFWSGNTKMECLRDTVTQLLEYGYAHHIQRLMVAGLFTQMFGVRPREVHDWFMALYVDSVEWVTLPNVVGMSQYADGGIVGSKPYVATGNYIKRQTNYCSSCRYNPGVAVGETACPFTTLYWSFLNTHRESLSGNNRMALQVRNLGRKSGTELEAIEERADEVRTLAAAGTL